MGRTSEYLAVDGGHFGGAGAIYGHEDDAAVHAANATPDPAMAFIKLLGDPANAQHWKDGGFEPAN